jgi:hypothetical protein
VNCVGACCALASGAASRALPAMMKFRREILLDLMTLEQ